MKTIISVGLTCLALCSLCLAGDIVKQENVAIPFSELAGTIRKEAPSGLRSYVNAQYYVRLAEFTGASSVRILDGRTVDAMRSQGQSIEILKRKYSRAEFDVLSQTPAALLADAVLANEFLTMLLSDSGDCQMRLSTDGRYLLYPGYTSSFSVKVDDHTYCTHEAIDASTLLSVSEELAVNGNTASIKYSTEEGVEITQSFILEGKACRFEVTARNTSAATHRLQVRYLFDTQIDDNDGAPLYAAPVGTCIRELDVRPLSFTQWQSWLDPVQSPDDLYGIGGVLSLPTRVVFAWWPAAIDYAWDYNPDTNQVFYTPGYVTSPQSDSCVLYYMDIGTLSPSSSKSVSTTYGTDFSNAGGVKQSLLFAVAQCRDAVMRKFDNDVDSLALGFAYALKGIYASPDKNSIIDMLGNGKDLLTIVNILYNHSLGGVLNMAMQKVALYHLDRMNADMAQRMRKTYDRILRTANINVESDIALVIEAVKGHLMNDTDGIHLAAQRSAILSKFDTLYQSIEALTTVNDSPYMQRLLQQLRSEVVQDFNAAVLAERTAKWFRPSQRNYRFAQIGQVRQNAYNVKHFMELSASAQESFRFVGWGAGAVIAGGLKIGLLIFCPPAGIAGWIGDFALASTAGGIVVFGGEVNARGIDIVCSLAMFAQSLQMNGAFNEEKENTLILVDDLASYALKTANGTALFEGGQVIVENFTVADIVLPPDGTYVGSEVGTATIRNLSALGTRVNMFFDIVGLDQAARKQTVSVSSIPEAFDVAAGNSRQVTFGYGAPDMQALDRYYQYEMKYHVSAGTSLFTQDDFAGGDRFFAVGRSDVCEAANNINRRVLIQSQIGQGQALNTTLSGSSSKRTVIEASYPRGDIDLHLYDANGNHVGVNYSTGQIDNQIPGALYSGRTANPEVIEVPGSANTYNVTVVGVDLLYPESVVVAATEVQQMPALLVCSPVALVMQAMPSMVVTGTLVLSEMGGCSNATIDSLSASSLASAFTNMSASSVRFENVPSMVPADSNCMVRLFITLGKALPFGVYAGSISIVWSGGTIMLPLTISIGDASNAIRVKAEFKHKSGKKGDLLITRKKGDLVSPHLRQYFEKGWVLELKDGTTMQIVDGPHGMKPKNKKSTVWFLQTKSKGRKGTSDDAQIKYCEKLSIKQKGSVTNCTTWLEYKLGRKIPPTQALYILPAVETCMWQRLNSTLNY